MVTKCSFVTELAGAPSATHPQITLSSKSYAASRIAMIGWLLVNLEVRVL